MRPSRNALKHGLFTRKLVQTAAPLRKEPEAFDALLADMIARFRPEGSEEALIVDRIMAKWWRLQRMTRYMSRERTGRTQGGRAVRVCSEEAERFAPHKGRLERSVSRLRQDLAKLQQYRLGRKPRWKLEEKAAHEAEREAPMAAAGASEHALSPREI